MSHGLFQKINGRDGEIRIEKLGVLVGKFQTWTMTRRGADGPGSDLYDLHAVFSYVNPYLMGDDGYEKTITVRIGPRMFTVVQEDGFGRDLDGRSSIRMQGVRLCQ